jgi:hypothetical protein
MECNHFHRLPKFCVDTIAYMPYTHKTKKRSKIRVLHIGARAQEILTPCLEKCKQLFMTCYGIHRNHTQPLSVFLCLPQKTTVARNPKRWYNYVLAGMEFP